MTNRIFSSTCSVNFSLKMAQLLLVLGLLIPGVLSQETEDLNPVLAQDRLLSGPGVHGRLTQSGLQYLSNVLVKAFFHEALTSRFAPPQPFQLANTSVRVSSATLLSLHSAASPIVTPIPPNIVRLHITNVSACLYSEAEGILADTPFKTALVMNTTELQLNLDVIVTRDSVGTSLFRGLASRDAIWMFRETICPRLNNLLESRVNARLALLPPRISLNRAYDSDLVKLFTDGQHIRTRHEGLDMFASGEIAPLGARTPFGPRPLPSIPGNNDTMIQMAVSDYVSNTLMYHGHKTDIFNTRVDPKTPHFGSMMRSSCDLSSVKRFVRGTGSLFCVGDIFPTIRNAFPKRGIVFLFSTTQAPAAIIRSESSGGIYFALSGFLELRIIDEMTRMEHKVGAMTVDITGTMKMRMTSKVVKGKISLDHIVMRTLTPETLTQNELDDASFLSHEIIQRLVNDILKEGLPIPVHPLFKLKSPKLTTSDRAMILKSNFELNEKIVRQLLSADMTDRKRHHS